MAQNDTRRICPCSCSPGTTCHCTGCDCAQHHPRPLHVIAEEISADWKRPYFGAVPYLSAMRELASIDAKYYEDSAASIVRYFLANAGTWRGETARRVKAELKSMTAGVH